MATVFHYQRKEADIAGGDIDNDPWHPPVAVVEDDDILNDPVALGERYARMALVDKPRA